MLSYSCSALNIIYTIEPCTEQCCCSSPNCK